MIKEEKVNEIRAEQEPIYITLPEKPEEKDYVICYIDFLGTKQNIKDSSMFNNIYAAYSFAINVESRLPLNQGLHFKVFSDNILIACEVTDPSDPEKLAHSYKRIVLFLRSFLLQFYRNGMLFRGGITFGKLAINDIMVWGSGLVDAVLLEEKTAIFPRIVISKELEKILFSVSDSYQYFFEEKFLCLKDVDDFYFVDYVNYSELPNAETGLIESRKAVKAKLNEESDRKIVQKYCWHLNYLERAKEIFNEYYGDFNRLEWKDNEENEG